MCGLTNPRPELENADAWQADENERAALEVAERENAITERELEMDREREKEREPTVYV